MFKPIKVLNPERILVFSAIVICICLSLTRMLGGIDHYIHDSSAPLLDTSTTSDVVLISVDDQSIESLGRWPWSRDIHASVLKKLREVSPKLVVVNFLFSEQEQNNSLKELVNLRNELSNTKIFKMNRTPDGTEYSPGDLWLGAEFISSNTSNTQRQLYSQMQKAIIQSLGEIDKNIDETLSKQSGDLQLSQEMKASTTTLMPLLFYSDADEGSALPAYATSNAARFLVQGSFSTKRQNLPMNFEGAIYPIPLIGDNAWLGHINNFPDNDGVTRSQRLLLHHNGQLYPSLALAATAASLGLSKEEILYQLGSGVILGNRKYKTDENLNILSSPQIPNDKEALQVYSYKDLLSNDTDMESFRDKIVILGITARSLSTRYKISNSMDVSASELLAFNITSLKEMDFSYTPPWAKGAIWLLFTIASILLLIICPSINIKQWIILLLCSVATTLCIQLLSLKISQIWLPLSPFYSLYALAFLMINLWKLSVSERVSFQTQIESSENSKVLGLTYQSQGQLDLAFDKFKRCKPDASIAEALYGLGLDFERKRLTHKANLVYQYIEKFNPSFRDVADRISTIENRMTPTAKPRTGNNNKDVTLKRTTNTTVLELPTFGRYHIEKKIGMGGMGAVYLGRDPKIDRVVAVKTLEFSSEYSGEALQQAKKRFYREAMAVGKLNHRNIVTLYDVGEDHDLAYIAMEYLSGADLSASTKSDRLLSLKDVVTIGIACADALDYAHNAGVIHRDIKPSNIFYQSETRKTWITDFGIALIINKDATRTHSTFGSPRYMSPEQIKDEDLDGRSDIYSLGVTLFHLLCGRAPYNESEVSAIIYAIIHNPTPELISVKPDTPKILNDVILKSMQKDKEQRYSTAEEMKEALKACLAHCSN